MKFKTMLLAAAAVAGLASGAQASLYTFTVQTANTGGSFNADPGNLSGGTSATFQYSGNLNFNNTAGQNGSNGGDLNSTFFGASSAGIYAYTCLTNCGGSIGTPASANFSSLSTFLASSGSASGYQYGSLYTISLGALAAGTTLTITHDDGVSLYNGGTKIAGLTDASTSAITEEVTITTSGTYTLYYARENGTPSVLDVTVPEPMSLALLGTGLAGLGLVRRKRKAS